MVHFWVFDGDSSAFDCTTICFAIVYSTNLIAITFMLAISSCNSSECWRFWRWRFYGTFLTFSGDRTLVSNQFFFSSGVLPFFAPFFSNFLGLFFLDYVFYVQPLRTISYKLKMNRKNATGSKEQRIKIKIKKMFA